MLDEIEIFEGKWAVLGVNVGHTIVTNGTLWQRWHSCVKLCALMWYCGVDVAYRWLSDWTRLQWALHMQWVRPLCAVRSGDMACRN